MFPIGIMYYFGTNLDDRFTVKGFWPTAEQSHKIPLEKEEIDRELNRMRMNDAVRRERRQREAAEADIRSASPVQDWGDAPSPVPLSGSQNSDSPDVSAPSTVLSAIGAPADHNK